ncbi:hypothetical protein MLD38_032043 [Melastoma candidum]|uniref:Uncharacterized protein n=1 Tax=Melastoma candidum TaxID=119954 RepID=A0ACB9MSM0_9MYRT|nr:hypothetical protein MLD38_032043 [Melastoma candidum]
MEDATDVMDLEFAALGVKRIMVRVDGNTPWWDISWEKQRPTLSSGKSVRSKGLVEVGAINKGSIILRFDNEQHLDEIVSKADWHLAGYPLLLWKWQPGTVINEKPTTLPYWIMLQGILLELRHKHGVHYLASSIGQLLKTNARSFNPTNKDTARVQVECAAKNGLSKTIEAIDSRGNPFTVSIVYETRALCCKGCGFFGHDEGAALDNMRQQGRKKRLRPAFGGGLPPTNYLPPTTSDHSPCLLRLGTSRKKAGPFKFFDFWRHHPGYVEALATGWGEEYSGLLMFRLCCKLKDLKVVLKKLNREGNV